MAHHEIAILDDTMGFQRWMQLTVNSLAGAKIESNDVPRDTQGR